MPSRFEIFSSRGKCVEFRKPTPEDRVRFWFRYDPIRFYSDEEMIYVFEIPEGQKTICFRFGVDAPKFFRVHHPWTYMGMRVRSKFVVSKFFMWCTRKRMENAKEEGTLLVSPFPNSWDRIGCLGDNFEACHQFDDSIVNARFAASHFWTESFNTYFNNTVLPGEKDIYSFGRLSIAEHAKLTEGIDSIRTRMSLEFLERWAKAGISFLDWVWPKSSFLSIESMLASEHGRSPNEEGAFRAQDLDQVQPCV